MHSLDAAAIMTADTLVRFDNVLVVLSRIIQSDVA